MGTGVCACASSRPAEKPSSFGNGSGSGKAPIVVKDDEPSPAATSNVDLVWETHEGPALERARSEHRPVMIDVRADWCAPCLAMESETFADARVKAEGGRFIAIRIDATDQNDTQFMAARFKYKVQGLPTMLLLDHDGHEAERIDHFVNADELLVLLKKVH